jgi:hypothetical protein
MLQNTNQRFLMALLGYTNSSDDAKKCQQPPNRSRYLYGVKICGPCETTQRLFVQARDRHMLWSISELNLFYKVCIDTTKGIDNQMIVVVRQLIPKVPRLGVD